MMARAGRPTARGPLRVDLDLLPASEREIIARALHPDPGQRFAASSEMIGALEGTTSSKALHERSFEKLPAVIPYLTLQGEPPPPILDLLPVSQIATELAGPAGVSSALSASLGGPYAIHPDGSWEFRCPARLYPGALRLKLEAFGQDWRSQAVHKGGESFHLQIPLGPETDGRGRAGKPQHLLVEVLAQPPQAADRPIWEVRTLVRLADRKSSQAAKFLGETSIKVFESLRSYLQASERRRHPRWACTHPLRVYPILLGLKLGDVIEGMGRNISTGGVGFFVPRPPQAEWCYLHWAGCSRVAHLAVLTQITRTQRVSTTIYEIGAMFNGTGL
jgi:hypothetical protein